jgi:hypothetical protein
METDQNKKMSGQAAGQAPAGTVKAKVQGMVADGPSAWPRLASLYDVALQIERASTRDEILEIVRSEAKWLLRYDV